MQWESEEQEKMIYSLEKYLRDRGQTDLGPLMTTIFAYVFQRNYESNVWLIDTFGKEISSLQDQIKFMQHSQLKMEEHFKVTTEVIRQVTEMVNYLGKRVDKIEMTLKGAPGTFQ